MRDWINKWMNDFIFKYARQIFFDFVLDRPQNSGNECPGSTKGFIEVCNIEVSKSWVPYQNYNPSVEHSTIQL